MSVPGYRIVFDLDGADADLLDAICQRHGEQPSQALLRMLRAYEQPGLQVSPPLRKGKGDEVR